ncbi:MAG: cytochrome c [Candidatus Omnitrophica bacterium]|nr:cytochrome c [Candidatus Omnitrophota bacterium]
MKRRLHPLAILTLLSLAMGGCGSMKDQPRVDPYTASPLFRDETTARQPVAGTVSRNGLHEDSAYYQGQIDEQFIESNPEEVTMDLLSHGQERFRIYCAPCHGELGNGKGSIVQRGFPEAASYHQDRLRNAPDGYLFDVITNGYGKMMPWRSQIPVGDRWAIIAYIRALQLSQHTQVALLSDQEKKQLEGTP